MQLWYLLNIVFNVYLYLTFVVLGINIINNKFRSRSSGGLQHTIYGNGCSHCRCQTNWHYFSDGFLGAVRYGILDARGSSSYTSGYLLYIFLRVVIAQWIRLLNRVQFETPSPEPLFTLSDVLDSVGGFVSGEYEISLFKQSR